MKLKHLESALSSLQREFPDPKVDLEQYPTSAHLAAWVALTCLERGDIGPRRSVLDLGCGTGMLALACALVETDVVMGVDCDEEALQVAQANCQELFDDEEDTDTKIEWILAKLQKPPVVTQKSTKNNDNHKQAKQKGGGRGGGRGRGKGRSSQNQQYQHAAPVLTNPLLQKQKQQPTVPTDGLPQLHSNCVDTVVTNPPFGTKHNAGMDLQFLQTAIRLARRAVYSFHKTSTRPFLVKTCQSWGLQVQVVAEMKFDIPQMYKFHKQKSMDVQVDLLRIEIIGSNENDTEEEEEERAEEQREDGQDDSEEEAEDEKSEGY
ncbi:methyltransferase like 5 [Seminavis robusta]|uniref:Methyltransferase like 5 n=1 Tax=Seminavis robusta TaxID=568900 RepID=A0A9N8F071_9STRA|nr:methyltransferase like 5 [Seminavis robusta]|eukprot:Sro2404_g326470.1 methyltransferase like 5 (320) ;mRNA; f:12912-13871